VTLFWDLQKPGLILSIALKIWSETVYQSLVWFEISSQQWFSNLDNWWFNNRIKYNVSTHRTVLQNRFGRLRLSNLDPKYGCDRIVEKHCFAERARKSPEHDPIDVGGVSVVNGIDGLDFGQKFLLQNHPALLNDDRLDVRVQQEDEVWHLVKVLRNNYLCNWLSWKSATMSDEDGITVLYDWLIYSDFNHNLWIRFWLSIQIKNWYMIWNL